MHPGLYALLILLSAYVGWTLPDMVPKRFPPVECTCPTNR
jgi:hypothetical protein